VSDNHPQVTFAPRWKELLDCHTPWGDFTVEFTMGVSHVYFPDEPKWRQEVPAHLQERWQEIVADLRVWCETQKIPLSIVPDAWVEFPENQKS
jgi:hypothetical protein